MTTEQMILVGVLICSILWGTCTSAMSRPGDGFWAFVGGMLAIWIIALLSVMFANLYMSLG